MDCPILYDVLYNANIIILMGMTIFCSRLGHLRAWVSAAPTELNLLLSAFPQGFISGFALISPWALQECRPFRALCQIVCCFPRVSYRALPSFHPGLCRSTALSGLFAFFHLRFPRVLYRALPSFHPGLCGSVALTGLFAFFYLRVPRVPYRALPSFHPGLCRSVALAGLIVGLGVCGVVFVKCVWGV